MSTRPRVRLSLIDAIIERDFMPKKCLRRRGRCQCGHTSMIHESIRPRPRYPVADQLGACMGRGPSHGRGAEPRGRCDCDRFVPYDYKKEQDALRKKLRRFAFEVLRLTLTTEMAQDGPRPEAERPPALDTPRS